MQYLRRYEVESWRSGINLSSNQSWRPVVYLDETCANVHDGKPKAWVEDDKVTNGTVEGVGSGL